MPRRHGVEGDADKKAMTDNIRIPTDCRTVRCRRS
jgi:hypothetical protein